MADKNLGNETISFENIIKLYENNPEITSIVIRRIEKGMFWKQEKDTVYISTDNSDDEILSIISGSTKVVFEEHEQVKEDTEAKEEYIMDPDIEKFFNSYAEPKRDIKKSVSKKKQRFTFKKMKVSIKELLDKLETLKEEDPERFKEIPNSFIEKIREGIEKGKKYIAIGLVALTVIGAAIGIGLNKDKPDNEQTTNQTQIEETIPYNTEGTTQEQMNEIDTVSEVEEDFIKDYLEAYNKAYGTEYTDAELIVTNLRGTSIYQLLDGRKVTRGEHPYETQKVLNELGGYESIPMESDVIQIVLSDGTILATYNITTGESIYSAEQIDDLKDKHFEVPELDKLGISYKKVGATGRLLIGKEVEDEGSKKTRIEEYVQIDNQDGR